jgi:hypothetical protein
MRSFLVVLVLAGVVVAQETAARCTCEKGNASWHYLRTPEPPPLDPDPCPTVVDGEHPERPLPKGWHEACANSRRMACFLRRHAASWGITCSLCTAKKCCKFKNWHNCPECQGTAASKYDPMLKEVLAIRGRQKSKVEVGMSKHYIVVTDIPQLTMLVGRGQTRRATQHELIHVYLQRCEQAQTEWTAAFGAPREWRTLVILVQSEGTRRTFAQATFGHAEQKLLYGGGSSLEEGWAQNGFCLSVPGGRGADKDDNLHFTCRHMIGHIMMSTYHTPGMFEKELPRWIFAGSAHWLAKRHPRNRIHAYFCEHEGVPVGGRGMAFDAGEDWPNRARKIAEIGPKRDPVENMFQASTAKQMQYDMHLRAWSWFEIFLRHDRKPFVKFIQGLREAKEARVACKEAFGQAPEHVDQRWRAFVSKDREILKATKKEKARDVDVGRASAIDLRKIRAEKDMQKLANRIRGLGRCQNISSARTLITLIDKRKSDRVREVISLVLNRTTDEKVLAYLRGDGWKKAGKLGRATLVRTFGEVKHKKASDLVRGALEDPFWLVRANASRALAQMADKESIAKITTLAAEDPERKVRVAAMDALGVYGAEAKASAPAFAANLKDGAWQVKSATCAAWAKLGNDEVVDTLIERLDVEGGRIHEDIRKSIVALTGMDRTWNAHLWKKWWAKARKWRLAERKSKAEIENKPKPKADDATRYAEKKREPAYYGIKIFAQSVGYVLDTSLSMEQGFYVAPRIQKRLGRSYSAKTRIGVCKQELEQSIRELDPRARFNVIFFDHGVRAWKDTAVAASPSAKSTAISKIKAINPAGQTNYYDALRVTLGMEGRDGGWKSAFADTPDTLFFLTDGTPTDGEITKSDELLSWWYERNRFARLRVHVIAMGITNVDVEFLRTFAETSSGTFVHLKGKY